MMKYKKKRCNNIIKILLLIAFLAVIIFFSIIEIKTEDRKDNFMFLASDISNVPVYQLDKDNNVLEFYSNLVRGTKVLVYDDVYQYENNKYTLINYDNNSYYVNCDNLVNDSKDVVKEKELYVRNATSVIEKTDNKKIKTLAKKGDYLEVLSYDKIDEDGNVNFYKVRLGSVEGYIYGKYTSISLEDALKNYKSEIYDPIHSKISNSYNGGDAIKLDFYPYERQEFSDNKMPDNVYALYLNSSKNVINNIDKYIDFARDTMINAFVVDIKDNEAPAYPSNVYKSLSPTNYERAVNSYDDYKEAISKLKNAGFYVIGRITTFKDSYYVKDNKEDAIVSKDTNEPYLHNGSYWPSAYDRDVWYFNVSLALDAVEEFGFNEINFDYVRFPDRMNSVSNKIDLKNTYEEDKTEAIQRFIQYACDCLHEKNVYVSVDVFGETTNGTYTTAYGQYWPAISNVVDVISGMPYPDHFSSGYYGLKKPWNEPYQLMKYWASYANDRQKEVPTPAKVRTWIQAYDVMKYVDQNGISYNASEVESEIRGLYEGGASAGYITWLSNSSLDKYNQQKQAFQIDYGKEYSNE